MRVFGVTGLALLVIAGSVAALTAMGGNSKASSLRIMLKEMSVSAAKSVPAGKVTFRIQNAGESEHEFVVLRWNGKRLPIRHFKAQENEDDVVGEAEDIGPGKTVRLTLNLAPGKYLLLCNFAGHYQLGMSRILRAR
jgi:uncharacterized cupredoxin-like copper-binding protein